MLVKPQTVRLFDVALIGPAMVLASLELPEESETLAGAMAVLGVGTIAYNLVNYLEVRAQGAE